MGLLDDPSKLLRPADVGQQWNTGAPYQAMPRGLPPNLPPATASPGMPPNLPPGMPMQGLPPKPPGPQSAAPAEDPRQTILALFKRFGLT